MRPLREMAADVAFSRVEAGSVSRLNAASSRLLPKAAGYWRCAMVTSRQKALVQDSFVSLAPVAEDVVALFYGRLFELDPALDRCSRTIWFRNIANWRRC